jgi:lysophospholipase L1-like esterase
MIKKHIVCFGDSNTWGYNGENATRFDDDIRWVQRMQRRLGEQYLVMEEGVNGRTTVFDDPLAEGLNGLTALAPALLAHQPIDLLVLMLGTNDCKERYAASAYVITLGIQRLIMKAKSMDVWRDQPRILLMAPMVMDEKLYHIPDVRDSMGPGSVEKSRELPGRYQALADEMGCHFLDSNAYVHPISYDYMHIAPECLPGFAEAVASACLKALSP